MLKIQVEEIQKNAQETLVSTHGACKFCGQMASLQIPEDWSSEMADELATELCNCLEAYVYTSKKNKKEKAAKAIEEQFGQDEEGKQTDEKVKSLLITLSDAIVENQIKSGTVDIGDGIKAKISVTAKGFIKVEKTKTEKTSREA